MSLRLFRLRRLLPALSLTLAIALSGAAALLPAAPAVAQTAAAPQTLTSGVSVGPLSDAAGAMRYFAFTVPAGATRAVFAIAGSAGDADLYVKQGSTPTTSSWTFRPYTSSSNETVTVTNPAAGTWYVMVRAYSAYSGLTVRATHDAPTGGTPVAAAPTLSPAPGTFSGQVNVALAASSPAGAVVRFTTDGSAPTEASEVYNAPVMITTTTTLRAAAFANGYTPSPVAGGLYTITSPFQALTNGQPLANLSGARGSVANFKVAVPAGAGNLTIAISGGTGDADLYVKYGQQATTSVWDQRPYTSTSNETVLIASPQAGDYFVMINGYSAYSGLTLTASWTTGGGTGGGVAKPDLTVSATALNPYITTQTFASTSCDVQEGSVVAGTRRLLRFSTQSQNIGTADLVLGNPANNPSFEWASCHGHYHFRSFAQYRLLDTSGAVVRTGRKVGFCLMDITRVNSSANPSARYNCSSQGIQAGWADVYSANLSGQWIDITGVAPGTYVLEVVIDPMNLIDEADETNNTVRSNVTIN